MILDDTRCIYRSWGRRICITVGPCVEKCWASTGHVLLRSFVKPHFLLFVPDLFSTWPRRAWWLPVNTGGEPSATWKRPIRAIFLSLQTADTMSITKPEFYFWYVFFQYPAQSFTWSCDVMWAMSKSDLFRWGSGGSGPTSAANDCGYCQVYQSQILGPRSKSKPAKETHSRHTEIRTEILLCLAVQRNILVPKRAFLTRHLVMVVMAWTRGLSRRLLLECGTVPPWYGTERLKAYSMPKKHPK